MSLPASRNRTYVDGSTPVTAADLNDLQDQIVAGKHGYRWERVPLNGTAIVGATRQSTATNQRWAFTGLNDQAIFETPALGGHTVRAIRVVCEPSGAGVLTISGVPYTNGTAGAALAGGTATSSGTGVQTITLTFTSPRTIAGGETFMVFTVLTTAGLTYVHTVSVELARL